MREFDLILGKSNGRYIKHRGSDHVAVLSATRAGKLSSYAIPNAFAWQGSMVCLDIKGEIFAATAGHRAAMGQEIIRFDPAALDERSHRWNPFSTIDRTDQSRFRDISRIGYLLFPEPTTGRGNDWFWEDTGRAIFQAVAMLLAETPGEPLTMAAILNCLTRAGGLDWLARKVDDARPRRQPYSQLVANGIASLLEGDQRRIDDKKSSVTSRLNSWALPATASVTAASDFDVRDIRRRPMSIYVVVAPADVERMSPLLRLFFGTVIGLNTLTTPEHDPSLQWQVHMLLDEFARLGKISRVGHFLQYAGGYGFRISLVAQDKFQVQELYGTQAAADIFANASTQIYLSGIADAETGRDLERRMGDDTVPITTANRPRFMAWLNPSRQGLSEHPHRRPLMLAQEILGMDPDKEVILRPGMKPVLAEKIRWWHDRAFRGLVREPPTIPELHVDIPMDDGQSGARRATGRPQGGLALQDMVEALRLPETPGRA